MAQAAASRTYKIDKLTDRNYQPWRMTMEIVLKKLDLLDIIDGSTACPDRADPAQAQAVRDWEGRDMTARLELLLHMDDAQKQTVRTKTTAFDIWTQLTDTYEHKDVGSQVRNLKILIKSNMNEEQDIDKFIQEWRLQLDNVPPVYAFVPPDSRDKLQDHAISAIFVGYGEPHGVKGYRLFDKSRRKFFFSRALIFDESSLISEPSSSHINTTRLHELLPKSSLISSDDPPTSTSTSAESNPSAPSQQVTWRVPFQPIPAIPPPALHFKGGAHFRLQASSISLWPEAVPTTLVSTVQQLHAITRVPVQMSMPKSQLQSYGETLYCCNQDLLGACAAGRSPIERFLCVVAWHISTCRLVPFAQIPFNPVIGETHHVSTRNLNILMEQVSHHPPFSALYATDEVNKLRMQWWHNTCPRFYGNKVEGTIYGKRTLWLDSHQEIYEMNSPKFLIRLFPAPGTEWVGTSTIKCGSSGLEAILSFKGKHLFGLRGVMGQVSGKIRDTTMDTVLYELSGAWSKTVSIKNMKTEESSILFDAQDALTNLKAPNLRSKKEELDSTESLVVWRPVMAAIVKKEWDAARQAKQEIEERQRDLTKQRKLEGRVWLPKHFVEADGEDRWQWRHIGQPVPQAPLVVPSQALNGSHV